MSGASAASGSGCPVTGPNLAGQAGPRCNPISAPLSGSRQQTYRPEPPAIS
jgi:hypothetical protein